jgi:CubicO group peptidase (beta-lactamase class C family)
VIIVCTCVPSVQFHAAYRNSTLASGACGLAQRVPSVNATTSTLYRLASVSKIFPALLLAQMAAAGRVSSQDTTLVSIVPDFRVLDPWEGTAGANITLRHLATHMAGLGRSTPAWINNTSQALAALAMPAGGMAQPAGATPQYSNIGFSLLGHVLAERVLGTDYASAISQWQLEPLGVQDRVGFNYNAAVLAQLAPGYSWDTPAEGLPFKPPGFTEPEGGAFATAAALSSMLQRLAAAAGGDAAAAAVLRLSPAQVRDLFRPVFLSADGSFQQGMPWEMFQLPVAPALSYLVRGKDGGLPGYTSYAAVIPELQLSVVMLWNGDYLGIIPVEQAFTALVPPLVAALQLTQPGPDAGPNSVDYVGTYLSSELQDSGSVSYANNTLTFFSIRTGAVPLSAISGSPDTFYMFSPRGDPTQNCEVLFAGANNAYIVFNRNISSGVVTGFTAPFTFTDVWTRLGDHCGAG